MPITLPDLPPEASHPDFHRFYGYWRNAAPNGALPGRQHIDPLVDLPRLIPSLVLYDVVPSDDELRFRVRVAGEVLVEIMGSNPAGRYIDDFVLSERRGHVNAAFTQVARTRIAHYWENQMWTAGRQYIRMQRLALPLARDGRIVDMIFACHVRVDTPTESLEEK